MHVLVLFLTKRTPPTSFCKLGGANNVKLLNKLFVFVFVFVFVIFVVVESKVERVIGRCKLNETN